jgi:hypothetical protein
MENVATGELNIVSADGHVLEPPDILERYWQRSFVIAPHDW